MASGSCSVQAIPYPELFGAEFLSIQASVVQNYSSSTPEGYGNPGHPDVNVTNASFCNVTITHTHPGQNDQVTTQIWLPTSDWNERMQMVGGGGYTAGLSPFSDLEMAGAVDEGYATLTTNAGHGADTDGVQVKDWAYAGPGNLDLYAIQNLATVSLNDAAVIAKSVIKTFYGKPPRYSYWSGCSQGGRQGYAFAQRYPTVFDGISAGAPAIYTAQFLTAAVWPQVVMNELGQYPHACELNAITAAAIASCDADDGLVDGLVSDPDACNFDADSLVGTAINCTDTGSLLSISAAAAAVAKAAWAGLPGSRNTTLWHGYSHEAALTGRIGVANTVCGANSTTCSAGAPVGLSVDWIATFGKKDPDFDLASLTLQDLQHVLHATAQDFALFGASYANLDEFRDAGGKLLTYHGLADPIIPAGGTRQYFDAIAANDPSVHDYYRVFEAPGLAHCFGGNGVYPAGAFDSLVDWVENGKVPDVLQAASPANQDGARKNRILCPYPQRAHYKGSGDENSADSFYCAE
ncbi:hypothetical protein SLS57_006867 [Botryosphaeria dothidea]